MKQAMRVLFTLLALAVLATHAARLMAEAAGAADDKAQLAARLAAAGLNGQEAAGGRATMVTAPDCSAPVVVIHVHFNGSGRDLASSWTDRSARQRIVYLGFQGERVSITEIAGRWFVASLLHAVGFRPQSAPDSVSFAMIPSSCPSLIARDWSMLSPWN